VYEKMNFSLWLLSGMGGGLASGGLTSLPRSPYP